jgi:hypothetical protein
MTPAKPQRCSLISITLNFWKASKVLITSKPVELLVASYFYSSCSYLQCYQGTPVFIARAVQQGRAVPLSVPSIIPAVPISPKPYTLNHPDRIKKFPQEEMAVIIKIPADSNNRRWRHELDHDVESVFWLILYWVMGAQPVKCSEEALNPMTWAGLTYDVGNRSVLIKALGEAQLTNITHSFYEGVRPLLRDLATILVVDRVWLEEPDARNDPEYACEAFQRLILQFILDNHSKEFMGHEVEPLRRDVEPLPKVPSLTETTGKRRHAGSTGKRKRSPSGET